MIEWIMQRMCDRVAGMDAKFLRDRSCRHAAAAHAHQQNSQTLKYEPQTPNKNTGTPVLMWQTLTMFELFHAAFDLSPGASVTTVCVTFAERMMMLTTCLLPFPQLRTNAHVSVPFLAWSATNVVRFAYAFSPPPSPSRTAAVHEQSTCDALQSHCDA